MQDNIPEIKQQTDIVSVISEFVTLESRGSRYTGCCPFHDEKTGSFTVFPDKQRFYCFGCHESGDVLDFLQKYHGMTLREVIKMIKPDYKPNRRRQKPSAESKHDKLIKYMDIWKSLYFDHLSESRRQRILNYCIDNWQPWHRPEHFKLIFFSQWRRRILKQPALMIEWKKNVKEYRKKRAIRFGQIALDIKTEDDLIEFILMCFSHASKQHVQVFLETL
jgi:DNA primase catalytic core